MGVSPLRPDCMLCPDADSVHLRGLIGQRLEAMRVNRLLQQEEYHLLWSFQEHCPAHPTSRPAPHPEITRGDYQGEFIGTWVAAASLAAWNSGDAMLRSKLDALVRDWLATQEADGYLGTYDAEDRWKSWDLWIQAHAMLGLVTYYRFTRDTRALEAAARVAGRVLQDFGPGRRSFGGGINVGMASSAILEPMVWLYWQTAEQRYLDFARWLVDFDWEAPGMPAIVSSLESGHGVAGTASGKGAEMLICLASLVELHRATGIGRYLTAVQIAWNDIVRHHLYVTGSASTGEYFRSDFVLRNDGYFRIGETCVTMTWLYLNLSLGRLTGEARYFDMVEQALYNHLLAAQSPDGRGWSYYTGLTDYKRYRWHTDPECCPMRGTRALVQMPLHVFAFVPDGLVVNFYEPTQAYLTLASGMPVTVELLGGYPFHGDVQLRLEPKQPAQFAVHLRLPGWCRDWRLRLNGKHWDASPNAQGYLVIDQTWNPGDELTLEMEMPVRVVMDALGNPGRVALTRGPLVFAMDASYLPAGLTLDELGLLLNQKDPVQGIRIVQRTGSDIVHLSLAAVATQGAHNDRAWLAMERYRDLAPRTAVPITRQIELVPFFEAGNGDPLCYMDGVWPRSEVQANLRDRRVSYQVWLPYTMG